MRRWLLLGVVFISGGLGVAVAHDPMASWATLRVTADGLTLDGEMAVEAAMSVIGVPMGSAPAPSNVQTLLDGVEQRVAAGGVYELTPAGGGAPWSPMDVRVERRDDDGIGIVVTYARTESARDITVLAPFLATMPKEHRSAFSVVGVGGDVFGSVILRAGRTAAQVALPGAAQQAVSGEATSASPAPVPVTKSSAGVFRTYLGLGVEHILEGYDHLLFLLALIVACRSVRSMLLIVTCFTVGHTITLALAVLDVVALPSRWVEALIAVSIIAVGIENLLRRDEPKGRWMVTLGFGLLHGFGFAGVLREIGFGEAGTSITVPLLAFNLGVELGQLAVVGIVLPLLLLLRRRPAVARFEVPAISTIVVTLGCYWLVQRLSGA